MYFADPEWSMTNYLATRLLTLQAGDLYNLVYYLLCLR